MAAWSTSSEQLNTMHCTARPFARSLDDSVLPVPAGPAGAPPSFMRYAEVRVSQQRSVSGVTTRRDATPWYSNPYGTPAKPCRDATLPASPSW